MHAYLYITSMHYRDIWKKHYGEIPKDENGLTYEIHHIDGNRSNNGIENLELLSIEEHYHKHKEQGDLAEASAVLMRMKKLKRGDKINDRVLSKTKWYHREDHQRQMNPSDPKITSEGWIKGMHPDTVKKIRETSHKNKKRGTAALSGKKLEEYKKKVSEGLKRAYREGRRTNKKKKQL